MAAAMLATTLGMPAGPGSASPARPAGTRAASQPIPDHLAAGPPDVLPAGEHWTVTLITGDVLDVRTDADGRVTAAPRDPTTPLQAVREPDGDLYELPVTVMPLLDRVLDRELFNVTGLIRQGYDDESIDVVPLIVQRQPGVDVQARLATGPAERPLPSIGAVATEVPKGDATATGDLLAGLAASAEPQAASAGGITRIWLDRQVTTLSSPSPRPAGTPSEARRPTQPTSELDPNLTQIGADRAWAAGFTGEGVTVAVLDTGIDGQHPDLAGQVVAEANFSQSPDAVDRLGHGTHVASIAAGTGAGAPGTRSGVAPDARLISGKVVDDGGFGFQSQAIAGMEWAAPQADVVNVSLGYGSGSDGSDPLSLAVDTLTEQHDTLFVIAAGNSGPFSGTVEFPGAADRALTVGAVDGSDALADFSSRGPLVDSRELKPELVAPGVEIVAARAAGTTLGEPVDDDYITLSGTSMAAPHAAGSAAVLAQEHPDWTANQLKSALIGSSDPVEGDGYDVGAGRLDIGDGVEAAVQPSEDVVEATLDHPRTAPHVETVVWTNTGTEPQTVALDVELEDRGGDAVDAVTVEPAELILAPGETGRATLTVDGPALDAGLYSGTVTADPAGGDDQDDVRTPVAVYAGHEMVDLTIETTPLPGVPDPPAALAAIVNLDDLAIFLQTIAVLDTTTVAVPVGRYAVIGLMVPRRSSTGTLDTDIRAQVGDPDIQLTEDTTVTFDGAAAVPFRPTVAGVDTAPPMYSSAAMIVTPQRGSGGFGLGLEDFAWHPMPPIHVTPMEAPADVFAAFQVYRLQAPHLAAEAGGDAITVTTPVRWPLTTLPPGDTTLRAVDVGDGSDLSRARDALAVVRLPADPASRAAVTQRALEAGVALLGFVDPARAFLTVDPFVDPFEARWSDVPVIVAAGASADRLLAAAAAGEDVTVTLTASPFVYDIQTPEVNRVDPEPVVDRRAQRELATLDERFHRDPDGRGAVSERRYAEVNIMNLDTEGPLPERRTAHVTPGVGWQSIVGGPGFFRFEGSEPEPVDGVALSMDAGRVFEPRSRETVTWVDRPQWPGPVGGPLGASFCQPLPVVRTPETMQVWLAPFQDGRDRFGCADPHTSTLTLERDGTVVGTADRQLAEFPVPAEAGTYRLSYEQTGQGPYEHRSSTAWTFESVAPDGDQPIPLLVVDYDLPLDTLNRPTGRRATFTVDQVTGAEREQVRSLRVWTSTDGGTSWRSAPTRGRGDGEFRVTLPRVDPGTAVSLRVDAEDEAGNRIEQTLYDAYRG